MTNGFGTRRFGAYLKQVRESRRLSLDAVEEASAIYPEPLTKSHLSRIENGRATPSFTRLFALGQIYGVPISAMAERFEVEFRRDLVPEEWRDRPVPEALREADHLRVSGRFVEAYALYSAILERRAKDEAGADEIADLQLRRVAALVSSGAYLYAKAEAERLLGLRHFSAPQRVRLLEILTAASLRLGLVAVAQMTLDSAESILGHLEKEDPALFAHLLGLRGMLAHEREEFAAAEEWFERAAAACNACGESPSALQMRINRGACLVRLGRHGEARPLLLESCREAEAGGLERHLALALSHLAKLEAAESNADGAEAYALRSNGIARARDYVDVVFRNCHILRALALAAGDVTTARMHEKTLRAYAHRVEPNLSEAREYLSESNRSDA
ncbi:MAG TPA: helix-turn-helix transcriptional regulator [Candidatus Polarisedimenticolaceae bacterium]